MKLKKIFNWRVWILIICLILSLVAINPSPLARGIEIKQVSGVAKENGLNSGDAVQSINGILITSIDEFNTVLEKELENREYNGSSKIVFNTDKGTIAFLTDEKLDISVKEVKKSNVILGLDLAGGTRVLLKPEAEGKVTDQQINDLISVLDNRLNVYGLSDLNIRSARDLEGNKFVLVEIAGTTREEVKELIGKQGVFEARIDKELVFMGSKQDITYVCKEDGSCSGIRLCDQTENGWYCRFEFVIHISPDAAKKHAEITKGLGVVNKEGGSVLEKNIDFYLDNKLVDSLNISSDLKGKEATQIVITGPGLGATKENAVDDAMTNMNKLQTILITGSLPLKLNIIKLDTISPVLGKNFINNSIIAGLVAIAVVALVIFARYRKFRIIIPMMLISLCETFFIIAFAAAAKWRIDIAAIAGIIAAVGTGVDDQIIITDEIMKGEERYLNWKQRIKRAFSIVLSAYLTTFVAMVPLLFAGAGLLRGFALTTLVGITIGIVITRPAFATMIEVLLEE